ncbi:hypothetical protein JST97_32955 [bacterium]|nr:hypothetical protein [bacterium]
MNFENAAEVAKDKLEGLKTAAVESVNGALDSANSSLNAAGEKLSETGAKLWESAPEGRVGEAVGVAAAEIEQAGEYLAEATVQDLTQDLAGFVRKHPLQSLAAGLLVGGLAGLAFSRMRSALRV